MKKQIYKILNYTYFFNDVGLLARVSKDKDSMYMGQIGSLEVTELIQQIFDLTKKQTKWYIKSWHQKNCKKYSFIAKALIFSVSPFFHFHVS